MGCPSGKRGYFSEGEVQEALIRSQIGFVRPPVNYYRCDDCGDYHLTSQGERHPLLDEPATRERIKREQWEQQWYNRFK